MSADVTPIREGVVIPDEVTTLRDALIESAGKFTDRFGHPPIGAAWVTFDTRGNVLTGYVIPDSVQHRQTLAFCGLSLTREAFEP